MLSLSSDIIIVLIHPLCPDRKKTVSGVSNQVSIKPSCSATENSKRHEMIRKASLLYIYYAGIGANQIAQLRMLVFSIVSCMQENQGVLQLGTYNIWLLAKDQHKARHGFLCLVYHQS